MTLVYDDIADTWVWVNPKDHDDELSPVFDTKQDAKDWYSRMEKYFRGVPH